MANVDGDPSINLRLNVSSGSAGELSVQDVSTPVLKVTKTGVVKLYDAIEWHTGTYVPLNKSGAATGAIIEGQTQGNGRFRLGYLSSPDRAYLKSEGTTPVGLELEGAVVKAKGTGSSGELFAVADGSSDRLKVKYDSSAAELVLEPVSATDLVLEDPVLRATGTSGPWTMAAFHSKLTSRLVVSYDTGGPVKIRTTGSTDDLQISANPSAGESNTLTLIGNPVQIRQEYDQSKKISEWMHGATAVGEVHTNTAKTDLLVVSKGDAVVLAQASGDKVLLGYGSGPGSETVLVEITGATSGGHVRFLDTSGDVAASLKAADADGCVLTLGSQADERGVLALEYDSSTGAERPGMPKLGSDSTGKAGFLTTWWNATSSKVELWYSVADPGSTKPVEGTSGTKVAEF